MTKIAVILFPGVNCEEETLRAVQAAGMDGEILRWNTKNDLELYDGFVLPGGWSYEDRIRAGVISAKDPIMLKIKQQAKEGKPVLGICNGCQVLVETGMIPGLKDKVQMALAPNINPFVSGFYCTWTYLKPAVKRKTAFNLTFDNDTILPIPIAHGEGRFTTVDENLINSLNANDQVVFRYCDKDGNVVDEFPINPNGSAENIAGICNKEGNVMGMMPHPERASWMRQVPQHNSMGEKAALGLKIFESMKQYIEARK